MEKISFKTKSTAKKKDLYQEKLDMLEEKYQKIKEILKQVLKDLQTEKEKNEILQKEYTKLEDELREKDELLDKMQSVSEAVVDEFSTLKAKFEMEAEAANNANKRATMYFHENLKLKENQSNEQPELADMSVGDSSIVFKEDSCCSDVSELEILNKYNSDLRTEIASLKIQLNKEVENQILLKEEFEAAKLLCEQERKEHKYVLEKFQSLEKLHSSVGQNEEKNSLENNIDQENMITGTQILENENNSKLEAKEENLIATITVIEQQKEVLQNRIKDLEKEILNLKSSESHNEVVCIPPPPPPPPPPSFNPIKSLFTFIYAGRKPAKKPIALSQENNENVHHSAMSEMINAIKKGSIQLKPVPKAVIEKEENITEPMALMEMKNILRTLKKREFLANENAKETKNEDLSNNIFDIAKNVDMKLNSKEVTNENNSFNVEKHANFGVENGSKPLLQDDVINEQACLGSKIVNHPFPHSIEIHSKSSLNKNNKLPDQNFKNDLDNDISTIENVSNFSSGSLNGMEFPSYSFSVLEDSKDDFIITI